MTIEPFKLVGQLIVAVKDEDGNIIGEQKAADMVVYAPQFDQIAGRVEEIMPEIRKQAEEAV